MYRIIGFALVLGAFLNNVNGQIPIAIAGPEKTASDAVQHAASAAGSTLSDRKLELLAEAASITDPFQLSEFATRHGLTQDDLRHMLEAKHEVQQSGVEPSDSQPKPPPEESQPRPPPAVSQPGLGRPQPVGKPTDVVRPSLPRHTAEQPDGGHSVGSSGGGDSVLPRHRELQAHARYRAALAKEAAEKAGAAKAHPPLRVVDSKPIHGGSEHGAPHGTGVRPELHRAISGRQGPAGLKPAPNAVVESGTARPKPAGSLRDRVKSSSDKWTESHHDKNHVGHLMAAAGSSVLRGSAPFKAALRAAADKARQIVIDNQHHMRTKGALAEFLAAAGSQ